MLRSLFYSLIVLAFCPCFAGAGLVIENFSEAGVNGYLFRHPFLPNVSTTWAQQFNTNGDDYFLDSISVAINRDTTVPDFTARLWTSSNSLPQTSVLNLSLSNNPATGSYQTHTFTPDNNFILDKATEYFFSIGNNAGTRSFLQSTVFGSNVYTGPATLISNNPSSGDGGLTWASASANEMVIRIDGRLTSVPEPSSLVCMGLLCVAAAGCRRRRSNPRFIVDSRARFSWSKTLRR